MIEKVIEGFYSQDPELLQNYHILAPCSLQQAVNDTVYRINQFIENGGKFVLTDDYYHLTHESHDTCILCAFFISVKKRGDAKVKKAFWESVDREYITHACIWEKNIRAKAFFEKNNLKFVDKVYDPELGCNYLIYKRCQQED